MPPKIASRFLLLLLLVVAAQAPAAASRFQYSGLHESDSFRAATEARTLTHEVKDGWKGARLKVRFVVDHGAVTARLRDGSGAVRWENTFRPGNATIEETFEGKPGLWKVELQLRNATGRYYVSLVNF